MTFIPNIGNAVQGNGPLAGQTHNFNFSLINFDWVTWHDYDWENWVQLDALLQQAIGFLNLTGIWRPTKEYLVNQVVFDPADVTRLYRANVSHTSGTDFNADKPLYWSEADAADPLVTSVFGRSGDIVAQSDDYAAFYPSLTSFNTLNSTVTVLAADLDAAEAVINNLAGRVTQTESDIIATQVDVTTAQTNIDNIQLDISALQDAVGKKILQTGTLIDDTNISSTTRTPFAANAQAFTINPTSPTSNLMFVLSANVFCFSNNTMNNDARASILAHHFDGSNYINSGVNHTVGIVMSGTGSLIFYGTVCDTITLTPAQKRSDNGTWFIRYKFNADYDGNEIIFNSSSIFFIEYEP